MGCEVSRCICSFSIENYDYEKTVRPQIAEKFYSIILT
jgi:hypothetical protein